MSKTTVFLLFLMVSVLGEHPWEVNDNVKRGILEEGFRNTTFIEAVSMM